MGNSWPPAALALAALWPMTHLHRTRGVWLAVLGLGLGGCDLLLPLGSQRDAGGLGPCVRGSCDPRGSGLFCAPADSGPAWQPLPCVLVTFGASDVGCGQNQDEPVGFCDPRWSPCVGPTDTYKSCDEYCTSINKRCCDSHKPECSSTELCVTSRNFNPGFGAEAWWYAADCATRSRLGGGQQRCDFPWDDELGALPRWRCCCV